MNKVMGNSLKPEKITCPKCDGTKNFNGTPCPLCEGKGEIQRDQLTRVGAKRLQK